jgi:hypothetical protein
VPAITPVVAPVVARVLEKVAATAMGPVLAPVLAAAKAKGWLFACQRERSEDDDKYGNWRRRRDWL